MDTTPLFSDIPHPTHEEKTYDFKRRVKKRTRTSYPVRYYYIDFGLSYLFPPEVTAPPFPIVIGGDKSVPEYEDPSILRDPFKIDIYCLGNIIRVEFMDVSIFIYKPLQALTSLNETVEDS